TRSCTCWPWPARSAWNCHWPTSTRSRDGPRCSATSSRVAGSPRPTCTKPAACLSCSASLPAPGSSTAPPSRSPAAALARNSTARRGPRVDQAQQVIGPVDAPLAPGGGLGVLRGNIAPEGAVVKVTAATPRHPRGTARVFDGEREALTAVLDGRIIAGDTVVIRYQGPRGRPGMREMLQGPP